MTLRCYYRKGGKEFVAGVLCEVCVVDESQDDQLRAEGWVRSVADLEEGDKEPADEVLQTLRNAAKERGIKGWQRMGVDKLRDVLGLNDGDDQE